MSETETDTVICLYPGCERPAVPPPAGADGGRCVFWLETDGLVGSTRIEYVRRA